MMKINAKKLMALLLCLSMVFSVCFSAAYAEEYYYGESNKAPVPSVYDGGNCIAGTTYMMEYTVDGYSWLPCADGSTAVDPGVYYVRSMGFVGQDGVLYDVSDPVEVTVSGWSEGPAEYAEYEEYEYEETMTAPAGSGNENAGSAGSSSSEYGLWVGGVPVTAGACSGSGWSYDPNSSVLSLSGGFKGGTVSGMGTAAVLYNGNSPLTINLTGDSKITSSDDCGANIYGIANFSGKKLTFTGSGVLSIAAEDADTDGAGSYGIYSVGDVEIGKDVSLAVVAGEGKSCSYGVSVLSAAQDGSANLAVNGSLKAEAGDVTADAGSVSNENAGVSIAVYAENITVSENETKITAKSGNANMSFAVMAGNLYLSGGSMTASAADRSYGVGIQANAYISGDAKISAQGTFAFAAMPQFVDYIPYVQSDGMILSGNDALFPELYTQHGAVEISRCENVAAAEPEFIPEEPEIEYIPEEPEIQMIPEEPEIQMIPAEPEFPQSGDIPAFMFEPSPDEIPSPDYQEEILPIIDLPAPDYIPPESENIPSEPEPPVQQPIPVTSVVIPEGWSLSAGEQIQLAAAVEPFNADNPSVQWFIMDGTDITVDPFTGVVTAGAGGNEGYVYAVAADGSGTVSNFCRIAVAAKEKLIESIIIPEERTLEAGEESLLNAKIYPEDATNPTLKWYITAGSDITVDMETGRVTAGAGGNMTYVYAASTDGSGIVSNYCKITVNPKVVPVSGISVSPEAASVMIGERSTAVVTVTPEDAVQNFDAYSSNPSVLSVVKDGNMITMEGLSKGTASVVITSTENASVHTAVDVVVNEPVSLVESISLTLAADRIEPGNVISASVQITPDSATDKSYIAVSSNTKVATVPGEVITGGSFAVTGVGEGEAVIRVISTSDNTRYADCTLTVAKANVPVSGISALPGSDKIKIGETAEAAVTILPADATDRSYVVLSSNESVVRVPDEVQTGDTFRFVGVARGNATVTVKSVSNPAKTYAFNVTVETGTVYVSDIRVETNAVALQAKGSYQDIEVKAFPADATNSQMTVTVADTSVANLSSVNGKLRITAVGQGSTAVTLTANDGSGVSNSILVNVGGITPVTGITLYNGSGSITSAETITSLLGTRKLYAYVTPSNATDTGVTWASSNSYVAYVTPVDGQFNTAVVTGYGNGTAVITATANDGSGVRAQCIVTVNEGTAVNYSITYKDNSGTWYYDYPTTFTVKCNGPLPNFFAAAIDGTVLNNAYFSRTGDNSSTTIVLSAACMQTLTPGKHTLTMYYNNGQNSASTYIFVQSVRDTPRTGDDGTGNLGAFLVFSALGVLTCAYVLSGRKKKNRG